MWRIGGPSEKEVESGELVVGYPLVFSQSTLIQECSQNQSSPKTNGVTSIFEFVFNIGSIINICFLICLDVLRML